MAQGYEWIVSLESATGFLLDTDELDVDQLGFLTTALDDSRVKIRSVSMQGGRNRELDAIQPSTATVVFDNRDGLFSPENTSSPYYGLLYPGKLISIDYVDKIGGPRTYDLWQFFVGFVSEWSWDFDVNGDAIAVVSATDTLGILSTITIENQSAPVESTGARIRRICALAGLNAAQYFVDEGFSILEATTLNGNALQLAQAAAFQEQGYLYATLGYIQFLQRNAFQEYAYAIFTNQPVTSSSTYNYESVQMAYSLDSVSNPVTTTSALGTATVIGNSQSLQYGKHSKTYETEFSTFKQQQDFAQYLVNSYGTPEFRPEALTFSLDRVLAQDKIDVSSYAIGLLVLATQPRYPVKFYFVDSALGMNSDKLYVLSSFSHSSTPASYTLTVGFEPATFQGVFRLDDPSSGLLDTGILAF
jgi:hypothetical protein